MLLLSSCTPLDRKITDELTEAERKEILAEVAPEDLKYVQFLLVKGEDSTQNSLPSVLKGTDVTYRDLIEEGRRLEGR